MENIYKKIENELDSLSEKEKNEILKKLREGIDEIDEEIVKLLNKRTLHSILIGRVKISMNLPTYNPQREKEVSLRINKFREPPLTKEALERIYERILDESRAIQREEREKGNIFKVNMDKMKIQFKKLLSFKEFLIVIFFFLALLGLFYYTFFTPNYYKGKSPYFFEVKKGESFSKIVDDLYKDGIIPNKFNMRIAGFIYGANKRIRAARYYIPNGLSYLDLLDYFINGNADYLKPISIVNGSSLNWVAKKLQLDLFVDSSQFTKLCYDKKFIDSLGLNTPSLLGFLLPQKYDMYERCSPREAVKIMYNGFKHFMNDSLRQRAKSMHLTIPQVVTMASIIEGETNKESEMPEIAGVYYNRLKLGMKLQADPTIEFIKSGKKGRLNYNDLKINSSYNTYKHNGLPPAPIDNPGKAAILAALYPIKNNYLFFVADGSGGHVFSKTYKEHLDKVKNYRKWIDSLKKK